MNNNTDTNNYYLEDSVVAYRKVRQPLDQTPGTYNPQQAAKRPSN